MTTPEPASGGWTPPPHQLPPPVPGPPPPGPGQRAKNPQRVVLIAVGAAAVVLLLLCGVGAVVLYSDVIFGRDSASQGGPPTQASSTSPPSIQGDYRPVENLCDAFHIDRFEDLVGSPPDEDPELSNPDNYTLEDGESAQRCFMTHVVDGFDTYKLSVDAVVKLDKNGAEELYGEVFAERSVEADSAKNYHEEWDHYSMVETEEGTHALAQHDNLFIEVSLYSSGVDKPKERLKPMSEFAVDLTESMFQESG